ncbi:MAG: site-specific DNA-methyltransferase, partial [Candidatus Cloacimonetes bacterium]|nr:site-specific DNA-methyltransferase [Candidatus Cloacimonadota bacterium]
AIENEGGIKLIYIDPPFAVGADFGFDVKIGDDEVSKKQTVLEEIAYRDTWGRGISSYLSMMYERLKLMHDLLADDGSIYVHCDWRVSSYLKLILDDIFGNFNFRNEIIWCYRTMQTVKNRFANKHDTIFIYQKKDNPIYNIIYEDYPEDYIRRFKYDDEKGKYMIRSKSGQGDLSIEDEMRNPEGTYRQYITKGSLPKDWWQIEMINSNAAERLNYPTQKPEEVLERIIKSSSNEGDIVCDFFCGSGTTAAVAEKLGRKWIVADLGRFAIHTTRKRMIKVQRELKDEGKNFRSFEILNLGKYERRYFLDVNTNLSEEDQEKQMEMKQEQYISLILEGYKSKRVSGFLTLHGQKADRFVYVGPIDFPVTKSFIEDILDECVEKTITKVDVLGFEFEMGLIPYIEQELSEYGVNLILKNIPREVFDKRAVQKGQVKFYDIAYLKVEPHLKGRTVKVELKDFVTKYTQDDLVEIEQRMRKGSDKVVIENGQIIKISKGKDDIISQEILTKNWYDWIDYWAVDFDYESKKEMIKINGNDEKVWTGNYIFENEWQTFRTKKNNEIEFTSAEYTYPEKGKYKIAVRVVDILGNDTLQVVEVKV